MSASLMVSADAEASAEKATERTLISWTIPAAISGVVPLIIPSGISPSRPTPISTVTGCSTLAWPRPPQTAVSIMMIAIMPEMRFVPIDIHSFFISLMEKPERL